MNSVKFQGKTLKVVASNEGLKPSRLGEYVPSTELETEERGKLIDKHESRRALMQKLTRDEELPSYPAPTITAEPTHCVYLSNLFDLSAVNLEAEPGFFIDLRDEVLGIFNHKVVDECKEYGDIEDCFVDQASNGDMWIKFANKNIDAAKKTVEKLNQRLFGGKTVLANFTTESIYNERTGHN